MTGVYGNFDVAIERRAAPDFDDGSGVCGDGCIVKLVTSIDGADLLVCVVDGLGHGKDAAFAADAALAVVDAASYSDGAGAYDQPALITRVHESIRRTRGVVMTLVRITTDGVRWCGVGNVDAVVVRGAGGGAKDAVVSRGGVVGYKLPPLRVQTAAFGDGDTLLLTTDGLAHGVDALVDGADVAVVAERAVCGFARGDDDALVCVVRRRSAP